jgi:hypothetical protein
MARDLASPLGSVRSDAEGRWRGPLLGRGPLLVLVAHPEYQTLERSVSLDSPGEEAACDTVLEAGVPIAVTARDAAGRPLADADVWLDLESERSVRTSHYLGRTGDLGELLCHRAPGARGSLRVRLAGYREREAPLEGSLRVAGRERLEVTLAPAPCLNAQAIDAQSGLPVTAAAVELQSRATGAFQPVPHRGILYRTLADGKIRAGLPPQPGTYRLVVAAAGNLWGASEPVEFDGVRSPQPAIVRLAPRARLSGVVLAAGRPVFGAEVELLARAEGGDTRAPLEEGEVELAPRERVVGVTRSDASGRFTFDGVPLESCRLAVRHPDYAEVLSPALTLSPAEAAGEVPVILSRGGVVRGKLLHADGEPAPGFDVVLTSEALGARRIARTDSEGRFELRSLAPASDYRLAVGPESETPGGAGAWSSWPRLTPGVAGPLAVAEGAEVVCDLRTTLAPAGALAGRTELDGEPVCCAMSLRAEAGGAGEVEIESGSDGRFLVRPLPPGRYVLAGASFPFARRVEVVAGERAEVEVRLASAAYEVEVVSAASGGRVTAPLRLRLAPARPDVGVVAERDARELAVESGRARVRGLLPGTYELRLEGHGYVPFEKRFELRGDLRERLALVPGERVRLRLLTAQGEPFKGSAEVTVERGDETVFRERRDIDEHLELPVLPSGRYTVSVRIDGRELRYAVTIEA